MIYVIFGVCAALLIGVAILAVKVVKENRKMLPKKNKDRDEEWL
jgi:hypothetical protein